MIPIMNKCHPTTSNIDYTLEAKDIDLSEIFRVIDQVQAKAFMLELPSKVYGRVGLVAVHKSILYSSSREHALSVNKSILNPFWGCASAVEYHSLEGILSEGGQPENYELANYRWSIVENKNLLFVKKEVDTVCNHTFENY